MRRLYLSLALVFICIIIGLTEIGSVNYSSDRCLQHIEKIETEYEANNISQALKIAEKTSYEYENFTEKIMFCYFQHSNLEAISENLHLMTQALSNNDINSYQLYKEKTKKQLTAIKEEELFTIQNIL